MGVLLGTGTGLCGEIASRGPTSGRNPRVSQRSPRGGARAGTAPRAKDRRRRFQRLHPYSHETRRALDAGGVPGAHIGASAAAEGAGAPAGHHLAEAASGCIFSPCRSMSGCYLGAEARNSAALARRVDRSGNSGDATHASRTRRCIEPLMSCRPTRGQPHAARAPRSREDLALGLEIAARGGTPGFGADRQSCPPQCDRISPAGSSRPRFSASEKFQPPRPGVGGGEACAATIV